MWTYHKVKELREKFENDQEISVEEKRKLEKYVRRKKKVAHLGGEWSEAQLERAEFLLHKIKKKEAVEVPSQ